MPASKQIGELSGEYVCTIRNGSRKRSIELSIDAAFMWNLYCKQKGRCALSGVPITLGMKLRQQTASLDRIDSTRGYIAGNVQWVHKTVNIMKNKLSEDEFLKFVKLIFENCSCR